MVCAFSLATYACNCPAGQASPAATHMHTLTANHASTPPAAARRSSSLSCTCRMTASPSSTCCRYRWSCAGRVGVNRDNDWDQDWGDSDGNEGSVASPPSTCWSRCVWSCTKRGAIAIGGSSTSGVPFVMCTCSLSLIHLRLHFQAVDKRPALQYLYRAAAWEGKVLVWMQHCRKSSWPLPVC